MKRLLIPFLLLSSCATPLARDVSEPAAEKGYPSAEFSFNGTSYIGLGAGVVEAGSSLSVIRFEVQGYLSGTVKAFSKSCRVDVTKTYTENSVVKIPLEGEAKASCVLSLVVLPRTSEGELKPLKGEFFLKVVPPGRTWQGHSFKIADNADELVETTFPSEKPVNAVIAGCSKETERFTYTPEEGFVYTPSADFLTDPDLTRCIAEGSFSNEDFRTLTSWQIWRYDGSFSPLPDPEINFDDSLLGNRLHITADENVLAIIWQGKTVFSQEAKIPVSSVSEDTVRLITSAGRTLLCRYNLETRRYYCLR